MIRCRSSILNWTGLVALPADFTCCWHFSSIEFLLDIWTFSAIAVNSRCDGSRKKSLILGRRLKINTRDDSEQNTNRQQKRQNNWRTRNFGGAAAAGVFIINNLNNSIFFWIQFAKIISFDDGLWRHDSALYTSTLLFASTLTCVDVAISANSVQHAQYNSCPAQLPFR